MTAGTIAARVLIRLVDFVAARGHDPDELCRRAGLHHAALRVEGARVPYGAAEALGLRAAEMTRDENLGLHLAQDVPARVGYDAGLLLLMASPSLRAGLHRMVRFQRYWGDGQRSTLHPSPGGLRVRYAVIGSDPAARRHGDECAMAEVVVGMRALSGREVTPRVVRFRHGAPADTAEHAALFGCALEFGAEHTELDLDDATLDGPLPHANEAYASIFQAQVEAALASLPGESGLADDVRAAARASLAGGACTLAGTARVLGVSARTLQRRLGERGTSFAALVDALRRELALEYLDQGVAVQEVAFLLGYAEASAFHHAFKRWTGRTPERARASSALAPGRSASAAE